ncbi:MAG: flagellar motor protein MotB [Bryobacteraceae bacterium]|jgi:chemotaxis protein MotB
MMPGTPVDDEPHATPSPFEQRPIIIIKKKVAGHGGRHGGAWKVAYADFVTAMMALFIVLWLMSSDKEIKEAIAQYFRNPNGTGKLAGTSAPGVGLGALEINKDDMGKLKEKIQQVLKTLPNFKSLKDNVELTVTPDGLRIELLENEKGMFFESGKAVPTERGSELLSKLAGELGTLPNNILIEGHTDAKPFGSGNTHSNWDLSTDRSNSARRLMESSGLRPGQVAQVRGFADRQLRHPEDPENPSNRRVSVIVQYQELPVAAASGKDDKTPPAKPDAQKAGQPADAKPDPARSEPAKPSDTKPSPTKPAKR